MKTGVDILIAYKMDFKEFKDKEGYFIIKESKKKNQYIRKTAFINRLKIKLPKHKQKQNNKHK